VLGVAAVGALLFDMLLLARGLVVSFGELLESIGYDVRVTATKAFPGLGPSIESASAAVRAIEALTEVDEVVPLSFGDATVLAPGCAPVDIHLTGAAAAARQAWTLLEGENLPRPGEGAPQREDDPAPIVVSPELATRLGVRPGVTLRFIGDRRAAAAAPPVSFRVVGVARSSFGRHGELWAVTTLRAFHRVWGDEGRDRADLLLVASSPGTAPVQTAAAIRGLRPDLHAFTNQELVARFEARDFSYFRQISVVLSSITLFFAFVLVTTLLTVSVNQRYAEIAGLRAIGFSRRRVAADLLWESAWLVGAGGALALPLGGLVAGWLDGILRDMPHLPERLHFFVFEPRALVEHAVLLAATGLLAAAYPVYLAARLPIAATLRREVVG
jgi:putative ABC transport system permease protein